MYGQMTAGSWIYIGTQGILQGTYETFVAAGRAHFGGDWSGRWILSAGLGGMGGAQPLAATMAGAAFLGVEIDPARAERRVATRYVDRLTHDLDEALQWLVEATDRREPVSIALVANAAHVYPSLVDRGVTPDFVTEQTAAHDPLVGYIPPDLTLEDADELRTRDPEGYIRRAREGHGGGGRGDANDGRTWRIRVRLRQQPPGAGPPFRGSARFRDPWLCPGVRPPSVLRGERVRSGGSRIERRPGLISPSRTPQ